MTGNSLRQNNARGESRTRTGLPPVDFENDLQAERNRSNVVQQQLSLIEPAPDRAHFGRKPSPSTQVDTQVFSSGSALSRSTDPLTSREAAARVPAASLETMVCHALLIRGPSTSHELADYLSLSLVTVSPRMAPLMRKGKVTVVGRRDGRQVWSRV